MRSISTKARSALPSRARIAPRSTGDNSAPALRQRSRSADNAGQPIGGLDRRGENVRLLRRDRPHRVGDLADGGFDQFLAGRGEGLPLHAAGDLVAAFRRGWR